MEYDKYIVCFSGGKDSTACFLHLLDQGIPVEKIELWHHEIDGREGSNLMDWSITPDYCRAFARAFNVTIYFSWKIGGFEREMLRDQQLTAPTTFEGPNGELHTVGGKGGKPSTRLKFPQVSPDLSVRWCSAYLKRDVYETAIRNQKRFNNLKTLVLTGERGEESARRATYEIHETSRVDLRDRGGRYVDHARPIRDWMEAQVWEIIERYNVRVHPCYYMGWSRCSCMFCIFGDKDQMASAFKCAPERAEVLTVYEELFGVTMKRKQSLLEFIKDGITYQSITPELVELANGTTYSLDIFIDVWVLPAGAYGKSCGPN